MATQFVCKEAKPAFITQPQSITALLPSHGRQKAQSTWVAGYILK